MSHYLTKEEQQAKQEAIVKAQTENPNSELGLTFLKDGQGWYADIAEHTRSENAMVAGADILLDRMADGHNKVTVKLRTMESGNAERKPIIRMNRILHDHFGGTYLVRGASRIPFPAWLCNVTHTFLGEHPKEIFIYDIIRENA